MKIAIVDDDPQDLRKLTEMMQSALGILGHYDNLIDAFPGAEELLPAWTAGKYELILLDIYMGGMHGIDAARKIRQQDRDVHLVFCTSGNDFASESYEVEAHDYLRKPVSEESILKMLKRLNPEDHEFSRFVTLPDGKNIILRNILYTDYHNHVVTIHNKKDGPIQTRISQLELENLLCRNSAFHCCHKGVIVNFYEIAALNENIITLSNGENLYISRRKEKEIQNAYALFVFERMRKEMRE
ncbi:MAG: response regulator transcription factor [Lachnospiraceae bacterium]|nr:response regulator transcription factor [Lachnospiraceae bacterium]